MPSPPRAAETATAVPPDATAPGSRSLLPFFGLVFALALPFWLIGGLTGIQLTADLPVSALQFVCPGIAAAILVYRENGAAAVAALMKRCFDYGRVQARVWWIPTILLPAAMYAATYGIMRLMELPAPSPRFPILAAAVQLGLYVLAGLFEEVGWSGYAIDPMQARWDALRASLLLGAIWTAFHFIPLLQGGRSLEWIAWWTLSAVTLRVLYTWLYNNTGKSVFAVALFHAIANLAYVGPFLDFGPSGYPLDAQRIASLLIAAVAAIVVVVWGPRTLARSRSA